MARVESCGRRLRSSDENLFELWRGEVPPKPEDGSIRLPGDREVGRFA